MYIRLVFGNYLFRIYFWISAIYIQSLLQDAAMSVLSYFTTCIIYFFRVNQSLAAKHTDPLIPTSSKDFSDYAPNRLEIKTWQISEYCVLRNTKIIIRPKKLILIHTSVLGRNMAFYMRYWRKLSNCYFDLLSDHIWYQFSKQFSQDEQ